MVCVKFHLSELLANHQNVEIDMFSMMERRAPCVCVQGKQAGRQTGLSDPSPTLEECFVLGVTLFFVHGRCPLKTHSRSRSVEFV